MLDATGPFCLRGFEHREDSYLPRQRTCRRAKLLLGALLILAVLSILLIAAPVMIPIFKAAVLRALQRVGLPQVLAATTVSLHRSSARAR